MATKPLIPPYGMGQNPQDPAGDARRMAMNGGKLPGLSKMPRAAMMRKDNPSDSPAKERAERRKGIKT